ncbi:MAG: T9SS type A sorting domain-containing protein [Flavobacterium sp.]|jgi:hypothetical protein|uniref:T9SS type A sorting domain-containing protein n=1 Tax=Flavobacterium sp. TaxID=239 RepID=UPI003BA7FA33
MKVVIILLFTFSNCLAQPGIEWQKTIGGSNSDGLVKLILAQDGYLLSGTSFSNISGDKTVNGFSNQPHNWIVKINLNSEILWQKAFGGSNGELNNNLVSTNDNGFLISNTSSSNISGNKTENSRGEGDYWLVKIDEDGTIEWQKTIGGNGSEFDMMAIPCMDGGYFVGGSSRSPISGEKTENVRGFSALKADFWVLKLDQNRNIEWQRTIGGEDEDLFKTVCQTNDGGFLIGGRSRSNIGFEKSENSRGNSHDFWIVKLSPQGDIEWQKTIGSTDTDLLSDMLITPENDILIGGTSAGLISGDKTVESNGLSDFWVLKLTSLGEIVWQKSIGGNDQESLNRMTLTIDGNYLLSGSSSSSISGDKTSNSRGSNDYWIVLIDSEGNIIGQKTIGGSESEGLTNIIETPDGGYFVGGSSLSGISGEKSEASRGQSDYWVLKLESNSLTFSNPILTGYKVFPNPTTELVNINFDKEFSGTIIQTDALGKVKQVNFSDVKNVSFTLFGEDGVYYLTFLTQSGEKESCKIIKKK